MTINLSKIIKLSIFMTGLSGLVAEYTLATLGSYLLGNQTVQWTLIISFMMCAMGAGSWLSAKVKDENVLRSLIYCELGISLLSATCAALAYGMSAYTDPTLIIYSNSLLLGLLIGLEIPLATRVNEQFEDLKTNVGSMFAYDYVGSLLGGLLFAFVALPYFGLTYTPIVLGFINLSVAIVVTLVAKNKIDIKPYIKLEALVTVGIIAMTVYVKPIILFGEQKNYKDKIVFEERTRFQKIVITERKGDYWLYLNGSEQFSSYDERKYHETLVHPVMKMSHKRERILVLGGGDGLAVRELLGYKEVKEIHLVDLDPRMTELAQTHPILTKLNGNALNHKKVKVYNMDANNFVKDVKKYYDVIIVDLPDPKSVDLARLYSKQFYMSLNRILNTGGGLITQASSTFFAKKAFISVLKSIRAAEIGGTIPMKNHIPTFGEWGWVMSWKGSKDTQQVKNRLKEIVWDDNLQHLNAEAMLGIVSFDKQFYKDYDKIELNDNHNLVAYQYYNSSKTWDIY